jgi:DNA (cytosine-5)-methyltransferase 1
MTVTLPNGSTFSISKRRNGCAPLPTITVADTISDLPGFEFINPCQVYPPDEEERAYLAKTKYEQVEVPGKGYVGYMEQDIVKPPLCEFQRQIRKGVGDKIVAHVTRIFNNLTVERICRIPMVAGADHSGELTLF